MHNEKTTKKSRRINNDKKKKKKNIRLEMMTPERELIDENYGRRTQNNGQYTRVSIWQISFKRWYIEFLVLFVCFFLSHCLI